MCEDCGCEEGNARHAHNHKHAHHHHHHDGDGAHTHETRHTLELGRKVLAENDHLAGHNREWLHHRGVTSLNLISAPGSGKTMLLEKTLERLDGEVTCAVITGDQQTDNDARRLQGKGAKVVQIETNTSCHLDASRVRGVLPDVVDESTQILFIENIGNMICPVAFDLGEDFRVAVLSTTEGEDKPLKYPGLFSAAQVVVLTKTDLIPHLDWDLQQFHANLQRVHPGVFVFELSARTGQGMDAWIEYLRRLAPAGSVALH